MKSVPRIGRILDLAGLVLFLAGAGAFTRAWIGFEGVPDFEPAQGGPAWAAIQLADGYLRLQWIGAGLMALGVAVFVVAWWVARAHVRRGATRAPGPPPPS
jgi:hypothetical protein